MFELIQMKPKDTKKIILISLVIICLLNLYIKLMPVNLLFVILFIAQLFYCTTTENLFLFNIILPSIFGAFFHYSGIPFPGGFVLVVGIFILVKKIKFSIDKVFHIVKPMLLVLIAFTLSAFSNTDGDYYLIKLSKTVAYGIIWCLTLYFFFEEKIFKRNCKYLGIILIGWGVFLINLAISMNNLPGPNSLFDYGFLRRQLNPYTFDAIVDVSDFVISYHHPGFISLLGLSIYFSTNNKSSSFNMLALIFICFLAVFYSGARQHIIAFILLLVMLYVPVLLKNKFRTIFLFCIFSILAIFGLVLLFAYFNQNPSNINSVINETGRQGSIDRGLELFFDSPMLGIGFGHYNFDGVYKTWPHNIIVELLAETGITGTLLIVLLLIYTLYYGVVFLFKTNKGCELLLFVPMLIRSLVSGDLTTNILLLCTSFALYSISKNRSINV